MGHCHFIRQFQKSCFEFNQMSRSRDVRAKADIRRSRTTTTRRRRRRRRRRMLVTREAPDPLGASKKGIFTRAIPVVINGS